MTPHTPNLTTVASLPVAVCDGLNIIRAPGKDRPRLEILLDVAVRLLRDRYDLLCVSDANTRFELGNHQGIAARRTYESLLSRFPDHFTEVPGGMEADPVILGEANGLDGIVVSSDRFRPYEQRFAWLTEPSRVCKIVAVRDHYYLNELRCPIPRTTIPLVADLSALLAEIGRAAAST